MEFFLCFLIAMIVTGGRSASDIIAGMRGTDPPHLAKARLRAQQNIAAANAGAQTPVTAGVGDVVAAYWGSAMADVIAHRARTQAAKRSATTDTADGKPAPGPPAQNKGKSSRWKEFARLIWEPVGEPRPERQPAGDVGEEIFDVDPWLQQPTNGGDPGDRARTTGAAADAPSDRPERQPDGAAGQQALHGWDCWRCGKKGTGYATRENADVARMFHICKPLRWCDGYERPRHLTSQPVTISATNGRLCAECENRADQTGHGVDGPARMPAAAPHRPAPTAAQREEIKPVDKHRLGVELYGHDCNIPGHYCGAPSTKTRTGSNSPESTLTDRVQEEQQQRAGDSLKPTACCPVDDPCTRHRTNQPGRDVTPTPVASTTNTEGDTMTQANTAPAAEATGIKSAIAHVEAVADAHRSHGGNEGLVASLAGWDVGADDIAAVQAAQEASRNAAEMWAAAATALTDHNSAVREAYMVSPGAANKTGQTNE